MVLLRELFGEVWIPPAVAGESFRDVPDRPGAAALAAAVGAWLREVAPVNRAAIQSLSVEVDLGEAEAIVLASERGLPLLIDELAGRRVARRLGLRFVGSAGVLLVAKRLELLPRVRPTLDSLIGEGLRLAPGLYRQILEDAGELA
jgi:predicted nucleic acid-binding protein